MKKFFIFSLTLMLCLTTFVVPSFASEIPNYDDVLAEYEQYYYSYYVYYGNDDNLFRLTINYDIHNYHETNGYYFKTQLSTDNSIVTYLKDSDGIDRHFASKTYLYRVNSSKWESYSAGDNHMKWLNGDEDNGDILVSSIDVYDSEGELFFQVPSATLAEAVMKVVRAEIPATQTTLAQTMKTIVLCGVGCLALLISLVLLVKALRRCLPR